MTVDLIWSVLVPLGIRAGWFAPLGPADAAGRANRQHVSRHAPRGVGCHRRIVPDRARYRGVTLFASDVATRATCRLNRQPMFTASAVSANDSAASEYVITSLVP